MISTAPASQMVCLRRRLLLLLLLFNTVDDAREHGRGHHSVRDLAHLEGHLALPAALLRLAPEAQMQNGLRGGIGAARGASVRLDQLPVVVLEQQRPGEADAHTVAPVHERALVLDDRHLEVVFVGSSRSSRRGLLFLVVLALAGLARAEAVVRNAVADGQRLPLWVDGGRRPELLGQHLLELGRDVPATTALAPLHDPRPNVLGGALDGATLVVHHLGIGEQAVSEEGRSPGCRGGGGGRRRRRLLLRHGSGGGCLRGRSWCRLRCGCLCFRHFRLVLRWFETMQVQQFQRGVNEVWDSQRVRLRVLGSNAEGLFLRERLCAGWLVDVMYTVGANRGKNNYIYTCGEMCWPPFRTLGPRHVKDAFDFRRPSCHLLHRDTIMRRSGSVVVVLFRKAGRHNGQGDVHCPRRSASSALSRTRREASAEKESHVRSFTSHVLVLGKFGANFTMCLRFEMDAEYEVSKYMTDLDTPWVAKTHGLA